MTHTHTHDAGQEHTHDSGQPEPAGWMEAASTASVAIDVGEGKGALVLYPSERFRGLEIEISPVQDEDGPRVHTGVHERRTAAGSALSAVFGSLAAGDYVVWEDAHMAALTVTVPDGAVAELQLV